MWMAGPAGPLRAGNSSSRARHPVFEPLWVAEDVCIAFCRQHVRDITKLPDSSKLQAPAEGGALFWLHWALPAIRRT